MSQIPQTDSPSPMATVLMTGHVIDSLTLTKVIDLILSMGGDYQLNDIAIGTRKKDFSNVSLNVSAPDSLQLQRILAEIQSHGAYPVGQHPPSLHPCLAEGVAPDEAVLIGHGPSAVKTNKGWLPIQGQGLESLVVVVNKVETQASLKRQSDLTPGEKVVTGYDSLQWRDR